ncbi:MlaD family protein [Nocardia nepalensis]|uniref:MlaD family protein n=1 Tax=Nocardia nepalensis TaxID=3375448 RepID=UPI003B677D6B
MQALVNLGRRPMLCGIIAIALAVVVAVALAVVYVRPPGRQAVVFFTDDSAAIRVGDSVRIAGLPVGKVTELSLEHDRVRVETAVASSAFVGDQSQIEVRMLTIVGGYYVNLVPLGDRRLGSAVIPEGRVRLPYSVMQTLADATKVTDNVKPAPVEQDLDQLQAGLTGSRIDSLRSIVAAGDDLIDTINRQRGQVSKILDVSNEYLRAFNEYRDGLVNLIRNAAILETTLVQYGDGFATALMGLGEVAQRISRVADFYVAHRDEALALMAQIKTAAQSVDQHLQPMIDDLRGVRGRMQDLLSALGPGGQQPLLLATDLCIPLPTKPC